MRTLPKIYSSAPAFSLLFGAVFLLSMPLQAKAGFFSSILGDQAHAEVTEEIQSNKNIQQNSQTMSLLQANVSSASVFQAKNDKKDNKKDDIINENANINIISDNAMLPATGPMGISDGKDTLDSSSGETSVYVVRKGDSLSAIANMFGVSVNTILAANDMKKSDKLIEGDVLFILPISGLEHTVTKGQTIKSIAKLYKVDINDIAFYNGLTPDAKLAIGDKLMVPGGEMADEGGDKPAPNLASALARDKKYYENNPIQDIIGYFINPVPTGRKTQGLHGPGHRGIDIGAPKGTLIYASAPGTVLIAKAGWSGGYGNIAIIQHPNGTKTLYAHMSKLGTRTGAEVSRGEVIGYVGSTGRSTGPHLHFEVFNARNPGASWSWAN
ncbi:MAG: metalloendopeptidase-like membrane protein [Parcubacteria group bacterium Gr01-1014_24]|nr:MAG: metalloendopeptidase-like membrane protein [Parcubacteria group bacterium Gr01-1014_24]